MRESDPPVPHAALRMLGELLEYEGEEAAIVVVGGAALVALGVTERRTEDVDVIARAISEEGNWRLVPPDPLPAPVVAAAHRVAAVLGLEQDWLNAVVGAQWRAGLPPGFEGEVKWDVYGSLRVGFAGRRSLIALKLVAAVDQGPASVHAQDLVALAPSPEELAEARNWVIQQDAAAEFPRLVEGIMRDVEEALGRELPRS